MAGSKEGARKARDKNLAKDPNYYAKIGQRSWANPERSHLTGFALLSPAERAAKGREGGKKTKNDYKTTQRPQEVEYETAESLREIFSQDQDSDSPSPSE